MRGLFQVSLAGCGFDFLLLDPEGQAESLLDYIGDENDIGGDLGDLAADQGAAFPEFGVGAGPIDFLQGGQLLAPVLRVGGEQRVARLADGLKGNAVGMDESFANLAGRQPAFAHLTPGREMGGYRLPEITGELGKAMGYTDDEANEAIRLSWCHLTPEVDWEGVAGRVKGPR